MVPSTGDSVLGFKYLITSTWYQALGTKCLVSSTWYQVLDIKTLVPGTWPQELGTTYSVPSTWYRALGTKYFHGISHNRAQHDLARNELSHTCHTNKYPVNKCPNESPDCVYIYMYTNCPLLTVLQICCVGRRGPGADRQGAGVGEGG